MQKAFGSLIVVIALAACTTQSSIKPVEYLDERTAMTVGALKEPIELVPRVASGVVTRGIGKHISFAYLGPVEWDSAGHYGYALWVHVAPGSDWTPADIRAPAAITLVLDEDSMTLQPMDAPQFGRAAYEPVASWGQTGYFELNVKMLQRMAASHQLELDVQGADGSTFKFFPSGDTSAVLSAYLSARAITGD